MKILKVKKLPKIENLKKQCDDLWSELVKIRANYKCEYCGTPFNLNSHHLFSRSKNSTRHDPDNGICVCVEHHVFSSTFSFHLTPMEATEWIKERRGEEWYKKLRLSANSYYKPDYKLIKLSLEQEIKKLCVKN